MPRKSIFSFSLKSPKPDKDTTNHHPTTAPLPDTPSDSVSLDDPEARYIPRQWQPNRLATLYVTPSEENLYLAAMASLDAPAPNLALWSEPAPQLPPPRQQSPLASDSVTTAAASAAASRHRFNLPLSPKLVTSPTLPPQGLLVREEFRSFGQAGQSAQHALMAFAYESQIRFHNFPHSTLVAVEQTLKDTWGRGIARRQPSLDHLANAARQGKGSDWVVTLRGKVWRRVGSAELESIRLILALLTVLGTQGWQLVEKVQATGIKTDIHNLLFAYSPTMANVAPAFFALSIPLPDRISLINPPNRVTPALISCIRSAILSQDHRSKDNRRDSTSTHGGSGSGKNLIEWDSWKGGIKLEGFVHPGVYRFWLDGLRRWLSGAVKWNVVERLHPPLILSLINALGAEHFHLLTSLPLLPFQKGRDVLIFQSTPSSGLSHLDSWKEQPSMAPTLHGGDNDGIPVMITKEDAMPARGEILPAELIGHRQGRHRASDDTPRNHGNASIMPLKEGRLRRVASVDSRPDLFLDEGGREDPHSARNRNLHRTVQQSVPEPIQVPLPVWADPDRPLTPEDVRANPHSNRKPNVLRKKPSLKDATPASMRESPKSANEEPVNRRRSFSFGRMRGASKSKPSKQAEARLQEGVPVYGGGYGGLSGEVTPEAVHPRSRHGIGSDATGESGAGLYYQQAQAGRGVGAAELGSSWSLVDLPNATRAGTGVGGGLGLDMFAPSERASMRPGDYRDESIREVENGLGVSQSTRQTSSDEPSGPSIRPEYFPQPPLREQPVPPMSKPISYEAGYSTSVPPPQLTRANVAALNMTNRPSFDSEMSSVYHDAPAMPGALPPDTQPRHGSIDRTAYSTTGRELHIANPTPPPRSVLSPDIANMPILSEVPSGVIADSPSSPLVDPYRSSQIHPTIVPIPLGGSTMLAPALSVRPPVRGEARAGHEGLVERGSVFGVQSVAGSMGYMGGSQSVLNMDMGAGAGTGAGLVSHSATGYGSNQAAGAQTPEARPAGLPVEAGVTPPMVHTTDRGVVTQSEVEGHEEQREKGKEKKRGSSFGLGDGAGSRRTKVQVG